MRIAPGGCAAEVGERTQRRHKCPSRSGGRATGAPPTRGACDGVGGMVGTVGLGWACVYKGASREGKKCHSDCPV